MTASYVLSFHSDADPRDLHSFPTRRSSDLRVPSSAARMVLEYRSRSRARTSRSMIPPDPSAKFAVTCATRTRRMGTRRRVPRSEEHTSELQSHVNLVCRLLLEKKKAQDLLT